MNLGLVLLIVLVLLLVGVFPSWPHAQGWGGGPVGVVGLILIIVVVLMLLGKL